MLRNVTLGLALVVGAATPSSGCYGTAAYDGTYSGAYVAPGVSVVSGYDYPVYYSDNAYWAYNNGYWYSAPYLGGGWVYATPPAAVLGYYGHYGYGGYHAYYGHYGPYYAPHGYYHGGYYGHGYYGRSTYPYAGHVTGQYHGNYQARGYGGHYHR
jgi:hypothetical protein